MSDKYTEALKTANTVVTPAPNPDEKCTCILGVSCPVHYPKQAIDRDKEASQRAATYFYHERIKDKTQDEVIEAVFELLENVRKNQ